MAVDIVLDMTLGDYVVRGLVLASIPVVVVLACSLCGTLVGGSAKACAGRDNQHSSGMRAVIQRVLEAAVVVDGREVSRIGVGLLVLLGVAEGDEPGDVAWLGGKVVKLRIFDDGTGKMNLSVVEIGGEVMVVSQFTLHASTHKGNRPSFIRAAVPAVSEPLYEAFCAGLEEVTGKVVARGVFGADMKVALVNDGPVTIVMDTRMRE